MGRKGTSKSTVEKTLKVRYGIQKKRTFWSLLFAGLLTLILNWNNIAPYIPIGIKRTLDIELLPQDLVFDEADLSELIKYRQYVPNYDTEIYVNFLFEKTEVEDYIEFKIFIADTGIAMLERPYFYILLIAPTGEAVSTFPSIGYISSFQKMTPWRMEEYGDFYKDCLSVETGGVQLYIPRDTLIDGNGKYVYTRQGHLYWSDPATIVYKFRIEDRPQWLGKWKIYIFVYDETYKDRFGNTFELENFASCSIAEHNVTPKTSPPSDKHITTLAWILIPFLITFVFTYLGIYSQIEKYKDKLVKIGNVLKQHWIFILIVIIIVVVQYLFSTLI